MKLTNTTLLSMKIIYTSIIIALIAMISSCSTTKRSMYQVKENNYYHDSTIVQEKLTVKPIYIPGDSTSAFALLRDLMAKGKMESKDRYYTTTIEYRDSTIYVKTKSDSVLLLLNQSEKRTQRYINQLVQKIESTQTEKKTGVSIYAIAALIFLIMVIVFLLWIMSRMKSRIQIGNHSPG